MPGTPLHRPTARLDPARPDDLLEAARLLRAGGLVALPTETVYGLAADARNPEAVRGIFAAKGRPTNHPLIVHLPAARQLTEWARDVPDTAWRLAEAFWPGPLTLLLHKAPQVSDVVTGGLDTIGLRMPAHPVMQQVLAAFGGAVAAPSANPYQRLSPTTAAQVLAGLEGRIDAVVDGGACTVGLESTIVDLTGEVPRIVRAGPVTRAALEAALGVPVEFPERHDVAVSGNQAVHYRPHTPLFTADGATLRTRLDALPPDARIALVHLDPTLPTPAGVLHAERMPADKAGYARVLYGTLHALDALGADQIWLETPPAGEDWRDVHDRLARAAHPL
jgi:L-threonylcarbamoyladenylate synthase